MNKTVGLYCFVIFLSCICNLNKVFTKEPIPLHLNYKGKYSSDIEDYEIVVPQRVNKDGSFISHLVSHHHSKRSTKELEFIFYKIPIGGEDYLIELTPNRKLISPGAVVEIHKEDVRKTDRFFNASSNNEKIGKIFKNLDIRKLENTECHFSGHVKGENISKAALSTCYGLAGFIQIRKGFYTIEPVAEHDPFVEGAYPHILYKTDALENSSVCHTMGDLTASLVDQVVRKRRDSSSENFPMYIETLIVMDKTLINHHQGSDCENYVLTVFNMAFNLFHDASLGLMMTLTIVRIIRLEVENDEMNLRVDADAEKSLHYFQTWQYEVNPGDDSHPNHHDIAVLITRIDVCYSPSSCGLLGLTTIGKACDPKLSAALCEDSGLRLGYVIAHEIGHLLGADHDSNNSTCNGTDPDGMKTVMQPHVSLTAQTWSTCSQAYFKAFFRSGMGNCFLDEPEEHHFNVQDLLPGVMYNSDFQCKHLISMNARECDMGSVCDSLNCYVPGYACIITHKPPADGTQCGENMWCHDSKCLVVGERPGAVDGNWGEWSAWSDCSRTCGSGVAGSVRNCDKPQPSHGGKNCIGERKRYKICAATVHFRRSNVSFVGKPCETGRPSFRDIQCGEFDDWIYPEDGKVHTWKAFYFHDDNPCTLYCINENKQVAALRPRVVDGTMCYRGIRDICVGGTCKSLPCDLHFESNAVEDACGICHGDGTACEFSEGIETFSKLPKGLTKIVNIPSGTRNIKVEEMSPTSAKFVVRDKDTRDIYVRGKTLGMFNVPGSQAWLGMIKKNQEALNIPGPVTKPLSIWVQRLENVTVKWSMALPAEQQRKPEFAWDFLKWGPCSAKCGLGTQKSEPSCMEEKSGLVEDSFCADLEMPSIKVRQCQVVKCEPRWMVGDWKGCEQPSAEKKERTRVVFCIKPIGEGEGESQIVADSECIDPKPHHSEPCENRQKREDAEYNANDSFFENDSMFKSDTSEFGFHKKYEDYLKHFAALSVPQRNSETIPLYLVSSPHFKHYFHVLETPEDSDTASDPVADFNLPNGTSSDVQTQSKVSPEFYKETFSGQQIDVSHVQSVSSGGTWTLENRTKKSVNSDIGRRDGRRMTSDVTSGLRKLCKRSKSEKNCLFRKNQAHRHYETLHKRRRGIRKNYARPLSKTGVLKRRLFPKNFNYASANLTDMIESLRDGDKSQYAELISKGRARELTPLERTKLRRYQWNAYNPKSLSYKVSKLFSHFLKKSKAKSNENQKVSADYTLSEIRKANKEFDGSGMKRLPSNFRGIENPGSRRLEDGSLFANPFNPMCSGKADFRSRKDFKERRLTIEDLIRERRNNRNHHKKFFLNRKEEEGATSRQKWKHSHLYKRKRSSRIWKKPKAGKEQNGNACGVETKNYLNNLFRDNHPKSVTPKPAETRFQLEKPIIREGVVVIDRDSSEEQEMDVLFQEDEAEEKGKYIRLPRPAPNERKISLKGQDVFNFLRELQRPDREAFYRSNSSEPDEKIEVRVKIPQKPGEEKKQGNSSDSSEDSEATTHAMKTNGAKSTTDRVATTPKIEASTVQTRPSENQTKSTKVTTVSQPVQETVKVNQSSTTGAVKANQSSTTGAVKVNQSSTTGAVKANQSSTTGAVKANQSSTTGAVKVNQSSTTGAVKANQSSTTGAVKVNQSSTTGAVKANQSSTTGAVKVNQSSTTGAVKANQSSTTGTMKETATKASNSETTTKEPNEEKSESGDTVDGREYDVDEVIVEGTESTTDTSKDKEKKKRKKKKEKEETDAQNAEYNEELPPKSDAETSDSLRG